MTWIKNKQKILISLMAILLIGGIFFYYISTLRPQLARLEALHYQNKIKQDQLDFLLEEYRLSGQTKNQVEALYMETSALEERIPSYQVSFMMLAEVIEYMDVFAYDQTEVTLGKAIIEEDKDYQTMPITIHYTTTYEKSLEFLELIKRSYQMMRVESYQISNEIQEEAQDKQIEVTGQTVETQLILNMYFKDKQDGQSYPNFMTYLEKEENIFARPREGLVLEEEKIKPENTSLHLDLADILRSGDNYSFSGYSPNQAPTYVGLTSSQDTKIIITIRDHSYGCLIEDSDGKKAEKQIQGQLINPQIQIRSQIQAVMAAMPRVSIHIYNYRTDPIEVNVQGTCLDQLSIYQEKGKITINKEGA